jgi:o-succinylbenzoate synthase
MTLGVSFAETTTHLASPIRVSGRLLTRRESLLVTLRDATGRPGVGEASPLPGYSPDTLEECRRELSLQNPDPSQAQCLAVRFALETALLALGQLRLPAPKRELGAIPRCVLCVTPDDAARAVHDGAHTIKLKIDGRTPFGDDLARIVAVRRTIGTAVPLRLDANGTLPVDEAAAMLTALAPQRPELIEEPVPAPDLARAFGNASSTPVPIALDESLQHLLPGQLPPQAAALVLKPMALGGLLRCLAFAAAAPHLPVVVTHLYDGPIALAATATLACVLPAPPLACALSWGPRA